MMWIDTANGCGKQSEKERKNKMKKVINKNISNSSTRYPNKKYLFRSYTSTLSELFPIIHTPNSNSSFI